MEGQIVSFRRSRHVTSNNQMLVQFNDVNDTEAAKKLVGKTVLWNSPGKKQIKGEIRGPHGSKGVVRVLFETGMPGQALGTNVKVE